MIGPERLQAIPDKMAAIMRDLQDWGIKDIANRIARFTMISSSTEYVMTTMMDQSPFDVAWKRRIAESTGITDRAVEELFQEAARSNYIYDKRAFEKAGIQFTPFENNLFVQDLTRNIIAQTQGDFVNITRSMGFARKVDGKIVYEPLAQFYQRELNLASTKVAAGVQTFEGAVKEAVTRMADSGLRSVSYQSGQVHRVDVAARRAVLAAMKEMTARQSEYNADTMGVTTFEFSWHSGHRPSHGWGGRRFDTTGEFYPKREEVYEKYGGGELDDYNCYHEQYAVFSETPPSHTDEQLDQMEKAELEEKEFEGVKYNAYDARQQQRAMERIIRKQNSVVAGNKGALEATEDEIHRIRESPNPDPEALQRALDSNQAAREELQKSRTKRKMTGQQYKAFSNAMGLRTEFERVNTGL